MPNKGFRFFVLCGFVLLSCGFLFGCASGGPLVFDAAVPAEQLCTLEVAGGLNVVNFDGTAVKWDATGWRGQSGGNKYKIPVKIPSGSHSLQAVIDLFPYNDVSADHVKQSGLKIDYDFTAGHTYFLVPHIYLGNGKETEEYNGGTVRPLAFDYAELKIYDNGQAQ
jgi:hypothetical protein